MGKSQVANNTNSLKLSKQLKWLPVSQCVSFIAKEYRNAYLNTGNGGDWDSVIEESYRKLFIAGAVINMAAWREMVKARVQVRSQADDNESGDSDTTILPDLSNESSFLHYPKEIDTAKPCTSRSYADLPINLRGGISQMGLSDLPENIRSQLLHMHSCLMANLESIDWNVLIGSLEIPEIPDDNFMRKANRIVKTCKSQGYDPIHILRYMVQYWIIGK